ncbi:MAG: GNAT family N-acetyltransferase [Candidatus Nanoarchaeia archaeon]|jgi:RimJ/RimL family protein N-acetyltransferase
MNIILKNKDSILRPLKVSDAKSTCKYIKGNKKYFKYSTTMRFPHPISMEKKFIQNTIKNWKTGEGYEFGIIVNGEVIGCIGLHVNKKDNNAELGYWLAKEFSGKGITTNAVKKVIKFGFNKIKLKRIYAYVIKGNIPSIKILTKSGFKEEGLLKKHKKLRKKYYDYYIFGKTK